MFVTAVLPQLIHAESCDANFLLSPLGLHRKDVLVLRRGYLVPIPSDNRSNLHFNLSVSDCIESTVN